MRLLPHSLPESLLFIMKTCSDISKLERWLSGNNLDPLEAKKLLQQLF